MANRELSLPHCFGKRLVSTIRKAERAVLLIAALSICFLMIDGSARAQSTEAASFSRQQLLQIAAEMQNEPGRGGNTSDALERHLDSATVLAVRTRNGRAEFHTTSADVFFVIEGHATLVTGGTIVNPRGTGEIRGDTISGGTRAELNVGDVVHIPPKTPHQLLLNGGHELVYVLVKLPAN